jgi:iron complex transport system ATP-binding protein
VPALRVAGLSAGYARTGTVISGIDLTVAEGEICGLIGPNGAGKSTLLRAILGLDVEMTGSVEICGCSGGSLTRMQRARLASYLPQSIITGCRLTVAEMVLLGRHPYRSGWSQDSPGDLSVAEECMVETGVWELRRREFQELSGGEKRLVMLASALAQEPGLLLLDEPGSSLDFRHQLNIWLLLRKLAARGIGVLVSTHEIGISGRFLDRVMVISDGGSRASGTPEEVFTGEILSEVFGIHLLVSRDTATGSWTIIPEVPE